MITEDDELELFEMLEYETDKRLQFGAPPIGCGLCHECGSHLGRDALSILDSHEFCPTCLQFRFYPQHKPLSGLYCTGWGKVQTVTTVYLARETAL